MTQAEKDSIAQAVRNEYSKSAFREYANKYYPKKQAKEMIKNYNDKLRGQNVNR